MQYLLIGDTKIQVIPKAEVNELLMIANGIKRQSGSAAGMLQTKCPFGRNFSVTIQGISYFCAVIQALPRIAGKPILANFISKLTQLSGFAWH